jgi:cytochrome bd-type quinol oxidase subunit 2
MENTTTDIGGKIPPATKTTSEKRKNNYNLRLNYAIKRGIPLPKQIILYNSNLDNLELVVKYIELITNILQANLENIIYINGYVFRNNGTSKCFQIPIHNKCVIISFVALICAIGISLFPSVVNKNLAKELLDSSSKDLFLCLLFICFLGTLGCTVLFNKINK